MNDILRETLCELAVDKSTLMQAKVLCTYTNQTCAFYRYCTSKRRVEMTQNFYKYGCVARNNAIKAGALDKKDNYKDLENGTRTYIQ